MNLKAKRYPNSGNFQRRNPNKVSINGQIRALEMRVIDQHGKNLGVLQKEEALRLASEAGLDLIEVSSSANPPICKIADYGKHAYDVSKKKKEVKAKQTNSETKNIQISVEISDNDILIKAKRAAEWLKEGHRVKIDLQMKGRTKYLEEAFLRSRMDRILAIIPCEYKLAEPVKKIGNKFMTVLEKVR
ncbi:Translation initiation factor IF-3 [bioreactor metagenome]|uniref:Translation initiation factor IF-3 n=1 Tax=bioreactor metagenome TaxID=1076179 RepID=A0A644UA25_9ZZZZ|nr:translation initiation factor IF-3 [Candidatus Elulimicrobiales bacterium]